MSDIYNYELIPHHMMQSIKRYVENRIECGGFLNAVLCNDLKGACGMADGYNIKIIPTYACYLVNHVPASCWGSNEAVSIWISNKRDGVKMENVL